MEEVRRKVRKGESCPYLREERDRRDDRKKIMKKYPDKRSDGKKEYNKKKRLN